MDAKNRSYGPYWPAPEPKPDPEDLGRLGIFWPLHVYLFASLFTLLSIVASVFLFFIKSSTEKRFTSATMMAAVFFLSLSRSVLLFVDPYLSGKSTSLVWIVFYLMLTGLGTAALTASLAILLYITAVSVRATGITRPTFLKRVVFGVTICNFVYLVTSDIVVAFAPKATILLTICQIIFSVWGIFIALGFAMLTWKIRKNTRASSEQASFNPQLRKESQKLRHLRILLVVLSIGGILFFVLKIKEAIDGIEAGKFVDSWPWWSVQTVQRSLEIINAVVLLTAFKKRVKSVPEPVASLQRTIHNTENQKQETNVDCFSNNSTTVTQMKCK